MNELNELNELIAWVAGLDPATAFLFSLPFLVAIAGIAGEAFRRSSRGEKHVRQRPTHAAARDRHAWS